MFPALNDFSCPLLGEAIDRHICRAFTDILCFAPSIEWHEEGDFSRFVTGILHPMGNLVWNARLDENMLDAQIESILAPMQRRGFPAAWLVGPNSHPSYLGESLEQHGLFLADAMPAMAVDMHLLPTLSLPPDTVISEVSDAEQLKEWMQVFSIGFELPYTLAECFAYFPSHLGFSVTSPVRVFLAHQKGKAVACSMLFLNEGLAGIYCVATVPEARRQGLGAAVTLYPLLAARDRGYRIGLLQASRMGEPVYRKLGFEEYGKVCLYILPGS